MNNLFQKTSSQWVKYSEYEYRRGEDGTLYLTPTPKAEPVIYDPLPDAELMVLDMLNVGRLCMGRAGDGEKQAAVLDFVSKYGLLGFMTALPTTPQFVDYEAVYLPKNHFIREETLPTDEYLSYFFPFDKLDFSKRGLESVWNVSGDRKMMVLAAAFGNQPQAMNMSFQREYAERYDWLATQFKDWAFTFTASFLYYEDYDKNDEATRNLYRQGMAAFGGIAPGYHILLLDRPTIVWDFHSLLLGVQMMFSFMLTDEKRPLRCCKHCMKVFAASHHNAAFCSPRCKNQYNVYKSRAKKGGE
ncbi:hypothetical protein LJC27_08575 [Christensenellaceae bacterium OttesenSCG-928-M15]|nr:hypothetical protein [Christensenellaceae bacterium OttesenSCG-928-M15]